MSDKQLFFDMDFDDDMQMTESGSGETASDSRSGTRKRRRAIRRAVLRWFELSAPPTGMGVGVITRIDRMRADVAAFWSDPIPNRHSEGPDRVLTPVRTAIVQCYAERDECWPDCIRSQEILPQLTELKQDLQHVESEIRAEEPELRDRDALFEEFAEWRYEESSNRDYHHTKRAIEKMEHGLYHGTKFERIRQAQLADHLYLAVPEGLVKETELADGWGLLWVMDDLSVRVIAEPPDRECLPSNRLHLIQNIAAAGKANQLLVSGIAEKGDDLIFTRPIRRRRGKESVRLSDL